MKIGIVNDLVLAAEALRRAIVRNSAHEVLWIAQDGVDAVTRAGQETPDLILMDLFMPRLGGGEATREIMSRNPCAIVVATANVKQHIGTVFAAMNAGAIDALNVPTLGSIDQPEGIGELLQKLETVQRLLQLPPVAKRPSMPPGPTRRPVTRADKLVVIGSSAGGPSALSALLGALPSDFPASVVIVQHVDKQFAQGLMSWFATHSLLPVRVAAEGDRLKPGMVYVAGRERHLIMFSPTQLGYSTRPAPTTYCPSVDVFFQSVAKYWRGRAVGVLLTGMGRDGAKGLKALRDAGHHTIAQDKGSSTVYGMPKAAVEIDAAQEILALDKIADRLRKIICN